MGRGKEGDMVYFIGRIMAVALSTMEWGCSTTRAKTSPWGQPMSFSIWAMRRLPTSNALPARCKGSIRKTGCPLRLSMWCGNSSGATKLRHSCRVDLSSLFGGDTTGKAKPPSKKIVMLSDRTEPATLQKRAGAV